MTLSHLVATAFTLVCLIAAAVLFGTIMAGLHDSPRRAPAQDAQTVARAIEGLAAQGDPATLDTVLRALADGRLRLSAAGWPYGPPAARRPEWLGPSLRNLSYVVLVGPDGHVLASSDPAGAAFAPPERDAWAALAAQAQRGPRDPEDLVVLRPGERPAALAAYPVTDERGRGVGAIVVAESVLAPSGGPFGFLGALLFFGAATVAVLAAASLFAFVSASVLAYVLARRLVRRLERLGQAAEALAAGDLSCRVAEGPADEVGQLARRFNDMAADLERSLRELQAERDRVAGLLDAQRQLVAGVSHELRTPVATLRGYVESALRREPDGATALHADLATMEQEIVRLQRLIDDLFTLSRAAVGRLALRVEPVDAGAVVRRLVETAAPLAWGQRRVQVLAEVPPDLPPAQADPQRLEQILSNLLGNAVRHTPPGGLVAAAVTAEPDAVRLEVRDTGEGIAPEDLPHIFERFYRGRNGDGRPGAGLGLALTKELAEAMGGSVEAASAPGAGSCFTVRLPRREQPQRN
ncbi:MAG TPA: HAMP domain-containing sensor histidine kinase [Chloroflexota bacterium]|nr:HAMP domain-containing sensor histidine kinase [Chloroflexota bacterium]